MKSLAIGLVGIALTTAMLAAGADQAQDAERLLKAAINAELVDGNLQAAIEQYKKVVQIGHRVSAAQALVRMAECYQKLGDAEARRIYEQVIREYADQQEAATLARARLGASAASAQQVARGDRAVLAGELGPPDGAFFGQVSNDGRFLTYTDQLWSGNVFLRDLATGTNRPLTTNFRSGAADPGWGGFSSISRDGMSVAYGWGLEGHEELRVVSLKGAGIPEFRRVLSMDDVRGTAPFDWSPDGKWLAVRLTRQDLSGQIALIGTQDGQLRGLKSTDWRGPSKILFSPDGRYIAYDLRANDTSDERHVFVMPTDGSRETAAVAHASRNVIMGWTRDGRHLLFASERTGAWALWAVPVADGQPQGTPRLIKTDVGSSTSLGSSVSGALYVLKYFQAAYLNIASIDIESGRMGAGPLHFQRFVGGGGLPIWSPDGKSVAYRACGLEEDLCALEIASVETGQVRALRPKMRYLQLASGSRWAEDGRSLTTNGTDLKGRRGLYRIDTQTAEIALIPDLVPGGGQLANLSPDGKKVFHRRGGSIFVRDVPSGEEHIVFRERAVGNTVSIRLSPDGRYIAAVEGNTESNALLLIPVGGGEPRELLRTSAPETLDGFRKIWTPDGRAIILPKRLHGAGGELRQGARKELWMVPVDGTRTRKLDINVDDWKFGGGDFSLSPDGRQIAFVTEVKGPGPEVWALENILSVLNTKP